jgi:type I restriction enzyme S subunit
MRLDACVLAPEGWQRLAILEVCQRITSGGTPSRKSPEFYENGTIGWVKTKELADGFIDETEEFITAEAIVASSAKPLPKDTILLAMYGATVGMLGILSKEMACNQACCALLVKPEFDRDFLFYQLLAHRTQLQGLATGAAQQNLSGQQIKELILPFPPQNEQKAIGSYLRVLDDRIALLRETNATLEAIAQAIFKSWFVDFDPVRAKQEGRAPEGMDEATAALFPDSFEESTLGLVPRGWGVGTLADLAILNPESWTAKKHPNTVAYIDLANAKDNEIAEVTDYDFDEAPSRARRVLRDGDTIVGTVRPGNRSFAFIHQAASNLTASTGFAVLRPSKIENTEFVYLGATQDSSIEHLAHVADGGAYPAVRPEVVAGIQCILPSDEVMAASHDVLAPLLGAVAENQQQAQTLAALRDTLLPRLISGQLRLPDAEDAIAEAAA